MYLQSVELHNFRNFSERQFDFCPGINVFFGLNASGKTNLLESIHVLSNLRSFRTRSFRELVQWEQKEAYARGSVHAGNTNRQVDLGIKTLAVGIKSNTRTSLLNSKPCKSSKDYLQVLPSATFVPDDLSLVKGAPAHRRYFLDKGTFHFYPPYWSLLTDYNRVLRQKNILLRKEQHQKKRHDETCDIWNLQLQTFGSKILVQRVFFLRQLQRLLVDVYAKWLGTSETVQLAYKTSIGLAEDALRQVGESKLHDAHQYVSDEYGEAIERAREREYRLGATIVGPHRDDIELTVAGRPLRAYGSQGQQRTAVLALKLAEIHLFYEQYHEFPILLLDDVTSELDIQRNMKLFEYLQQGMQVFMTATNRPDFPTHQQLSCTYIELGV